MEIHTVVLPSFTDERGSICIGEHEALPFAPQRTFWIYGNLSGKCRGGHAHRSCEEIVFALSGSFMLRLHNGKEEANILLNSPTTGVIIPANTWCELSDFSADALILCLASEKYDETGYINEFNEFIKNNS